MGKNRKPLTKREITAIQKDYANGVAVSALVKKYSRHCYTLNRVLTGGPRKSEKTPELDKVNEALSYSDKGHGAHSALFKQIFALLQEKAPEIHRVTLDVENRQAEFNTVTSHKVTL